MNIAVLIVFLVLLLLFILLMLVMKKVSIVSILRHYFRNYFSNADNEKDRKFNVWYLLALGILPYALGVLLFYSFPTFLMNLDTNLLLQVDIILLTIFCLFIGLDLNKSGKEEVKKELVATLLINILLIVASVVTLLVASSITIDNDTPNVVVAAKEVLLSIYFALNFKIIVMFFYSLKRMFILSSNDTQTM